ncbi:MAG: hypothetical protein C0605_08820 [Hyphomicrobiales bacterium]|nr:MAG: hypothetical protein C0605_08820 [Hyphomicrobiales bacterium]
MASIHPFDPLADNPLDLIEHIADGQHWPFERGGDEEITLTLPGKWAEYQLTLNWREDLEALHLACMFDIRVPENRREETGQLILKLNEQLWLGHFDIWGEEGGLMFRYGLMLSGGASANLEQCQSMMELALEACERFYPAFQYVIWAGHSAADSLEAVMFETVGEA